MNSSRRTVCSSTVFAWKRTPRLSKWVFVFSSLFFGFRFLLSSFDYLLDVLVVSVCSFSHCSTPKCSCYLVCVFRNIGWGWGSSCTHTHTLPSRRSLVVNPPTHYSCPPACVILSFLSSLSFSRPFPTFPPFSLLWFPAVSPLLLLFRPPVLQISVKQHGNAGSTQTLIAHWTLACAHEQQTGGDKRRALPLAHWRRLLTMLHRIQHSLPTSGNMANGNRAPARPRASALLFSQ